MFNAFERAVAGRYLRARRGERFVSVIAGFSLVGIALGVATLIIVMSVMGGFQVDLLNRILGFNGHLGVYGAGAPITNYDELAASSAFLPLEAAQIFFQMPGAASHIEVTIDDPDRVGEVRQAITQALADNPAPLRLVDWTQSNNSFFAAVQVERNVMFLIL